MKSGNSSILYAFLLVALFAVPQASGSIAEDIEIEGLEDIREIENSTEEPVNIVSERDSTGFNRTVTTADERTITRTTPNRSVTVIEKPDIQIEVVETPSYERIELESSEGLLIDYEGSDEDRIEVHGPEGTLVEKTVNGTEVKEFDGLDVEAIEQRRLELKEMLEDELNEVEFEAEASSGGDFELNVQPDNSEGNGEFVEIFNTGDSNIDLEGWSLQDSVGVTYNFSSGAEIEEGSSIRLYTDYSEADYNWDFWRAVWNQDGDTAYLYDDNDELVVEESYS